MSCRETDLARACAAARAEHEYAKRHVALMEAAAAHTDDAAAAAAAGRRGSTEYVLAAGAARVRAYFAGHNAAVARAQVEHAAMRVRLAAAGLEYEQHWRQHLHLQRLTVRSREASTRTRARRAPAASISLLALSTVLLPAQQRPRWLEDWRGELGALETRRARFRFVRELLRGMPRMAWSLRYPVPSMAGAGSPRNHGRS